MTGSALMDFLIVVIALAGAVAIIWYAIASISPDPTFTRIARIAIGVVALIVFLLAVKAVLFGGGGAAAVTPMGILYFAIAVIVILVVVYIIKAFLSWMGGVPFSNEILYVVCAIALIAFLYAAATFLFGGGRVGVGVGHLSWERGYMQGSSPSRYAGGIARRALVLPVHG